jgi:dihydroneopterin aldolase
VRRGNAKPNVALVRQDFLVTDTLWLEVAGLTTQVLTGIYSEETHLPQPLRISVRARLALADH